MSAGSITKTPMPAASSITPTICGCAERARTEALRELDIPHAEMTRQFGLIFMVRRAKLDYLAPARLDEQLIVATRPLAIGAASVVLVQSFHAAAPPHRTLAVAEIQLACVRMRDMRPARIPPRWRDTLATLAPPRRAAEPRGRLEWTEPSMPRTWGRQPAISRSSACFCRPISSSSSS